MTPKQATYYLHRIYRLLKGDELDVSLVHFRSFIDEYGERRVICGEASLDEIAVDPRNAALAEACIHEPLHILRPDWSERKVRKTTEQIACQLSLRQWRNLLGRFVASLT